MSRPVLLGISGALRRGSTNRLLLREAAEAFGECEFQVADIDLPLFDGDIETEEGIPAKVQALADQIKAADAVVISSPEYNRNIPGGLKNALDWVSRTEGSPWRDKPVSLMGAAAGRSGGERMMNSLILCMMPFRANLILGPDVLIANCRKAFETGRLEDERSLNNLRLLMEQLRAAIPAEANQ